MFPSEYCFLILYKINPAIPNNRRSSMEIKPSNIFIPSFYLSLYCSNKLLDFNLSIFSSIALRIWVTSYLLDIFISWRDPMIFYVCFESKVTSPYNFHKICYFSYGSYFVNDGLISYNLPYFLLAN